MIDIIDQDLYLPYLLRHILIDIDLEKLLDRYTGVSIKIPEVYHHHVIGIIDQDLYLPYRLRHILIDIDI